MRILKTASFAEDAKGYGLNDELMVKAIKEVQGGLVDASLGGNLYKKRIGLANQGKSGGLRTILVHKATAENLFCIYVFAKNETENISKKQILQLKVLGKLLLSMNEKEIEKASKAEQLQEVF